jgi:phosphoribosylglycinamide formyltransferase-1
MDIVCFVSGSGTNYREIVRRDPQQHYMVFTNRPGCGGTQIARQYGHEVVELSHIPFLRAAAVQYGGWGRIPRNCPERVAYEQEVSRLIEGKLGGQPDLICLAGYDRWTTDWFNDRYYPRILNVHPGDTVKGYDGLYWIPSAKAILAGDTAIRSTLFIVDKGEDTGPVLVQSAPLEIAGTLAELEKERSIKLKDGLSKIVAFARSNNIRDYADFVKDADADTKVLMEQVCNNLQDALKIKGDWIIYPFAVHDLIAKGRVGIEGRTVYVDGKAMPGDGYRIL